MLEKAIAKINAEMRGNNNSYVAAVGTFLLHHLSENQKDAEKILVEGKTITGSLAEMRKVAEKKKVGNVAVLSDAEGFGIVLKYFGITGEVQVPSAPVPVPPAPPSGDFDIKLEDLL